jgi:Protein of unknown function (DUF3515)
MTRPPLAAVLGVAALLSLSACGGQGQPDVTAGPSATDPGCASLLSRVPQRLLDRPRGTIDVAGAAVWGDPAIVLRCGVERPGPSSDQCLVVDDAEWLFREDAEAYRFTLFGRSPVLELSVPASIDRTQAPGALAELGAAVAPLPGKTRCPA